MYCALWGKQEQHSGIFKLQIILSALLLTSFVYKGVFCSTCRQMTSEGLRYPWTKMHKQSCRFSTGGENSNRNTSRPEVRLDSDKRTTMHLGTTKYHSERCACSAQQEGACYTNEECRDNGGHSSNGCPDPALVCCIFELSCGDVSAERITYFQSPEYPAQSMGTLACDYDIIIQHDVCAVRIEYKDVELARKLGGVCDIDQIFILNSVDGPTTGQCGPLSGYSTTIAVNPGQSKPVKLALVIQNEAYYHWNIKLIQLRCSELNNFRAPVTCGRKELDSYDVASSASENIFTHFPNFFSLLYDVKWRRYTSRYQDGATWWKFPEPIFNTFYYALSLSYRTRYFRISSHTDTINPDFYPVACIRMKQLKHCFGTTKKHLQQESSHMMHLGKRKTLHLSAEKRIVGGTDAELHEFPWQVAIFLEDLFFCGGALINDEFVITAAHCLMTRDTPIEELVLQLGDHDLTSPNETEHVTRGVQAVLFHSHFHPFLLSNDIALLHLDKPVAFSNRIRPVCLPDPGETYTGRLSQVVGWGITAFPMGEPSPVLQKLEVETLSNYQCSRIIEEPVGLGMLCAAPSSLQGTCFGDSGGPLTTEEADGSDVLIGVVSFGVTGCAVIPAFPDLYTRVSEYLKWIDVNAII